MKKVLSLSLLSALSTACTSLQATYEERLAAELAARPPQPAAALGEADLARLPPPVRRYLRRAGAVGKPPPRNVRFSFDARMYRKPGDAPMVATSEQHNFFARPARLFLMKARMFGLPVRVLHAYLGDEATMRVRVASLVDMVDLSGDELSAGETVTVLNDMCFYAPATLVDPRLAWAPVDDRTVGVTFTNGRRRVTATLHFDERDDLVNFTSDDRPALLPDGTLRRYRWSTPVSGWREVAGRWLPTHGDAVYDYPEGPFTYGSFDLTAIAWDVDGPAAGR
jgi:hypothetical protein